MNRFIIPILLAFSTINMTAIAESGSMLTAKEKTARIEDGRIVIETDEGLKSVDFTMERGHRVYRLDNHVVKENIDAVSEALKVYEKKSTPVYHKKVWIYDTINDQNQTYVDFVTNQYNSDIVFSPNEDFVYYSEYSPDGEHKIYGVKVGTEDRFFINTAEDFFIETCSSNDTSYVVLSENGSINSYHVFDLEGNKVQFIEKLEDINDLTNVICY